MTQTEINQWVTEPDYPDLISISKTFSENRTRPIPDAERYPAWHALIRKHYGQCPRTLSELDYGRYGRTIPKRGYIRDDREDDDWEDHFANIHYHTEQ